MTHAIAQTVVTVLALTLGAGLAGVVAVYAIARSESFRSDAGARFTLWLALLIVLAIVAPLLAGVTMLSSRAEPVVVTPSAAPVVAIARFVHPVALSSTNTAAAPVPVYAPPQPAKPAFPIMRACALVWLLGALAFAARIVAGVVGMRRFARKGRLIEMRASSRGNVAILEHTRLQVPVAIGYLRPAVLIPQSLLASASVSDLEHIVLHELEHLQRFDDVTSLVQAFCMSLLWFNPFAHYVHRRLSAEREMACDEAVVRRIGARHGYASTLWNIALSVSDSLVPSFTSAFAAGSQTVHRVSNLLDSTHKRAPRIASVAAVVFLLAGFISVSIAGAGTIASVRPIISDAASVAFGDGTTLLVGGRNADGSAVADASVYRGADRIALIAMPVPRWSATATRLRSGDVLITGGMTTNGTTADVELFHARSRVFESVGRLHVARVAHTATLLADGTVLIAAGERAPGKLESSTERYDPATRQFTLSADGYGRISQTAIRIDNGDVLMMGGDPGRGRKNCAIIYSALRRTYRDAGTLVRADARQLTFRLPGGTLVTHTID